MRGGPAQAPIFLSTSANSIHETINRTEANVFPDLLECSDVKTAALWSDLMLKFHLVAAA